MQEPLGSGRRFKALESKLAKNSQVRNPAGLAAAIGRKKMGASRFNALAAASKRKGKVRDPGHRVKV